MTQWPLELNTYVTRFETSGTSLTLYADTSQSGRGTPCESSLVMTCLWCCPLFDKNRSRYEARSRHASSVALKTHKRTREQKHISRIFSLKPFSWERVQTWILWCWQQMKADSLPTNSRPRSEPLLLRTAALYTCKNNRTHFIPGWRYCSRALVKLLFGFIFFRTQHEQFKIKVIQLEQTFYLKSDTG